VLDIVELRDRAGDRVGGYSHGMGQRLGIAAALLRAPRLLLLDEPATGLDPAGMRDMRRLIRRLAGEGMTVLLSSHLLAEVEEICNRVAIIRSGGVVYEGSLATLRRDAGLAYLLRTTDDDRAARVCATQRRISAVAPGAAGGVTFRADDDRAVAELSVALIEAGALVLELSPRMATLEDLFFQLTEGDGAGPSNGAVTHAAAGEPA
jgi:ABC-2 type transport system ATP-binding protein